MSDVVVAEVERRGASDWLEASLRQGFDVSAAVVDSVSSGDGRFHVVVRQGFQSTQPDFSAGGVIGTDAADGGLAKYLDQIISEPSCVVVEDELAKRSDPAAKEMAGFVSFIGDRIIHWRDLESGDGGAGAQTIRKGAFGYPLNAFLVGASSTRLGLVDREPVQAGFPDLVVENLRAIIVAAFDAESFLVWRAD